jgi:hypothetical protein
MATQDTTAPPDTREALDLRRLADASQPILTAAGRLELRRITSLGPLQRTRVTVMRSAALEAERRLGDSPMDAPPARLEALAQAVMDAEDDLLRQVLVDVTDEQLELLPAPERVGILAAFFGASPTEARAAVDLAERLELVMARAQEPPRPRGAKSSRASSGSTAATRRHG